MDVVVWLVRPPARPWVSLFIMLGLVVVVVTVVGATRGFLLPKAMADAVY